MDFQLDLGSDTRRKHGNNAPPKFPKILLKIIIFNLGLILIVKLVYRLYIYDVKYKYTYVYLFIFNRKITKHAREKHQLYLLCKLCQNYIEFWTILPPPI